MKSTLAMLGGQHIELITTYFNSSSNTTLMFWLYNQIIPLWVGMSLMLMQKNSKSVVFIFALLLLYSPFPAVALIPVVIYLVFKKYDDEEYAKYMEKAKNKVQIFLLKIKRACTFENFSAIPIAIIIGLFYMSNIAVNKLGVLPINQSTLFSYIMYVVFEFLIYIIFIYKNNRKDMILNILIVVTLLLPFIKMGNSYDFARRTCIPLAFYIMLLVMKELQNKNTNKFKRILLIIVICLGAITPMTEIIRTVEMEQKVIGGTVEARSDKLPSTFEKEGNECYDNFIANTDSIFYKYIAKKQ